MSNRKNAGEDKDDESSGTGRPAWWLMFWRELTDLWFWGRALYLIILYSVLLGIMAFVLAANSELDLIPPKEMVFLTLQVAMAVGLFIGLIIGADSISGERERATLEGLLLAPASRRQIVAGKYLAAISPWPVALLVAVPFLFVLSQGDPVFWQALFWGGLLGSILAPAFTAFGMLVSVWSNSNKTSLFVSLTVYILFLLPTQFPGTAQAGTMGQLLKKVNPLEATNQFLEKILVNNRTLEEMRSWLIAPVLFAVLVLGLLFWYAAPRLRLDATAGRTFRLNWGRAAVLLLVVGLLVTSPALAQSSNPAFQIDIDEDYRLLLTGDELEFNTLVTYTGTEEGSPPLIVAMNIINLEGDGDPVDPEDWSPERTQYIDALAKGESADLTWVVNPILEGDYMVYMVVIPEPDGSDVTSQPVASSGIHLTVEQSTGINPGGVLPIAIGIPLLLVLVVAVLFWLRRRRFGADDA